MSKIRAKEVVKSTGGIEEEVRHKALYQLMAEENWRRRE